MNDWDFKVGDSDREKKVENRKINVKKAKEKNINIEVDNSKGHVSRKKLARDFKKKKYDESLKKTKLVKRTISFTLDLLLIAGISHYLINYKLDDIYDIYKKILFSNGINQPISKPVLLMYFQYITFLSSYLLLSFLPVLLMGKSFGKMIMGLDIVSDDEDETISRSKLLVREVFKIVSIISLIGILVSFVNKKRKPLHDLICKSNVI